MTRSRPCRRFSTGCDTSARLVRAGAIALDQAGSLGGRVRNDHERVTHRTFLRSGIAVAGAGVLAACGADVTDPADHVSPTAMRCAPAEARRNPGAIREVRLNPSAGPVDLGGAVVTTWTYGGAFSRLGHPDQGRRGVARHSPQRTSGRCSLRDLEDGQHGPLNPSVHAEGVKQRLERRRRR